ncbi:metallophosphoesterase family protein [Neobacillus soli]|uniref:metallophosphoesterase family protein n=1 Tax=Neobacillus soli TaxID=220688 RepID=UPI000825969C|nr:metallophosphoesterase family protein [Neobacillus soli]
MRIAFISDIHGNATALDAVLGEINQRNVEKVFVLGDLCFRGPEPHRSLELVKSLNAEVIKGNADEWIVRGIKEGEVPDSALEMMSKERDWALSQLDEGNVEYLKNLPTELKLEYGKVKIHAYHATPHSLFEVVTPYESDQLIAEKMMGSEADIYIYAHIHKPYIRYINGKCIINIGSVGLPFDGLAKSSYALLEIQEESFQTSIVRVAYDVNKVIKQFTESDYPNSEQMKKILSNSGI